MFQEYPKWLYDGMEGILIADAEEEAALGEGYSPFPVEPVEAAEAPRRGRPRKVVEA